MGNASVDELINNAKGCLATVVFPIHCEYFVSSVRCSLLVIYLGWQFKAKKKAKTKRENRKDSKNIIHPKLCDSLTFKWMASFLSFVVWSGGINDKFKNWLPYRNDKCNFKTFMGLSVVNERMIYTIQGDKSFSKQLSRSPSN